jgi:uncharacterized integral membrane protein
MMFKNLVVSIILAIVFTWFALANSQPVTVSLLFRSWQVSLSLVILICLLLGVIFTGLVSAAEQRKMYSKQKELEKKIAELSIGINTENKKTA